MDTINHTIITEKSREIRISGDAQNVEIVNKSLQVEIIEKNSSRIAAEVGAEAAATEAEIAAEAAAEAEIAAEAASAAEEVQEQEAVTDAEAGAENVEETAASAETEQAELEEAETVVETAAAAEEEESAPAETAAAAASEQADQPAPENEETAAVTEESAEPENARKDKDKKKMVRVIGVRFRTAGKIYFFAPGEFHVRCGSHVIVETARGVEYGTVVGLPMDVSESRINQPLKEVIRIATPEDNEIERQNRIKEREAYRICQEKIQAHGLDMKLINAEYTFDNNKVLFYFTADGRVDFRDLVKDLASVFRTRIELRQIGVRDETKILGGYGICGRPLCCHTWMSDFIPVSIKMAKEQNLSLNPGKISGVCGRLMCCLKNEADTYEELNRSLPKVGDEVQGNDGLSGQVESVNVLRQTVRILVEVDDEKEYHEYHVNDITVLRRRRRGGSRARKENTDPKEAQELEKLENQERQERSGSGRRDRSDRQDRGERQARGDRGERSERQDRGERSDRQERAERGDRGERSERQDRGERQTRGDRQDRAERSERQDRGERQDRSDRQDRGDRGESNERGDRNYRRNGRRRYSNNQNSGDKADRDTK